MGRGDGINQSAQFLSSALCLKRASVSSYFDCFEGHIFCLDYLDFTSASQCYTDRDTPTHPSPTLSDTTLLLTGHHPDSWPGKQQPQLTVVQVSSLSTQEAERGELGTQGQPGPQIRLSVKPSSLCPRKVTVGFTKLTTVRPGGSLTHLRFSA